MFLIFPLFRRRENDKNIIQTNTMAFAYTVATSTITAAADWQLQPAGRSRHGVPSQFVAFACTSLTRVACKWALAAKSRAVHVLEQEGAAPARGGNRAVQFPAVREAQG